jgi:hypothetical protein
MAEQTLKPCPFCSSSVIEVKQRIPTITLFAAIVELKVPKRKHPSLHVLIGILVQLMGDGRSLDFFFSSPSMESPKRKRIADIKAGILMIDQVKPAVLEGTAVRFDLSKGKGIK